MNPVYDFIGTTNSTKITKKIKDRDIQKIECLLYGKHYMTEQ